MDRLGIAHVLQRLLVGHPVYVVGLRSRER